MSEERDPADESHEMAAGEFTDVRCSPTWRHSLEELEILRRFDMLSAQRKRVSENIFVPKIDANASMRGEFVIMHSPLPLNFSGVKLWVDRTLHFDGSKMRIADVVVNETVSLLIGDIARVRCDAIVVPGFDVRKQSLSLGGGINHHVHNQAGPALLEEYRDVSMSSSRTGGDTTPEEAREKPSIVITRGYMLPAIHVAHVNLPMFNALPDPPPLKEKEMRQRDHADSIQRINESQAVRSCQILSDAYRSALDLSLTLHDGCLSSLALTCIATGHVSSGFGETTAACIALATTRTWIDNHWEELMKRSAPQCLSEHDQVAVDPTPCSQGHMHVSHADQLSCEHPSDNHVRNLISFVVHNARQHEIYEQCMQLYFPSI
jgi:O-acetyl-ADP-ribose deacetylase (regulator of RNase III)